MRHWFSDVRAFRRDPLALLQAKAAESTEPLVPLRLGPKKIFLVADPELVKPILKGNEKDIDKGCLVHKLRPIVGKSSLTISGPEHKQRREAVGEQLSRGQVERLIPMLAAEVRRFAALIASEGRVEVHQVTPVLALKLISIVLFGHHALKNDDEQSLIMAVRAIEDQLADDMFRAFPLTPWAAVAGRKRREIARAAMSTVVRHVRGRASDASVLKALDRLGLDDEGIRDEVLTMLLAGHHTTGSAAAWILYHLATDPKLLDAIAAEAASISDSAGEPEPERIKTASLSLSLAREVLRLYPSSWWFSREVRRTISIGGRVLAPGTSLIISPWQMHRDCRYWSEPDQFRLDRSFTSKAYIPFGAGPRACVGLGLALLELQLLALEIASAYSLDLVAVTPAAKPRPSLTLLPPAISIDFLPRRTAYSMHETAA